MKKSFAKNSALFALAVIAIFAVGAWFSFDAAQISLNQTSITASAAGVGCGGCGGSDIFIFYNTWTGYMPHNDGGGGGGGVTPACTLDANPTTITAGQSSTLSWNVRHSTNIEIDNGIGAVGKIGSSIVSPTVTTTYTLIAHGNNDDAVCQQTIIVNTPPTPVCSADLSKDHLIWSTQNATSVVITAVTAGSPVIPSPQGLSGSYNFVPALGVGTHTYNLTASGPGGTVLCGVTVTITPQPAPTCTLHASPNAITTGGSSTLSWTTTNATSVTISQGIGGVSANGSTTVSPTTSKTYTLTASGPGGTVTCNEGVSVTPPPVPVCFLDFSATALSWNTTNASSVTIVSTTGSPAISSPGLTGSRTFSPALGAGTHSYTLTALGAGGSVVCKGTITVEPPPSSPSCTLDASATSILTGGSSVLSWTTTNATSFSITPDVGALSTANGSTTVSPTATKTYTLTAVGAGGSVTCQKTITVTPPSPTPSCTLTASATSVVAGGSVTLSWTTANATSVSIDNGVGSVATSGSKSVTPSATKTYTLTAIGAGGTVKCEKTITVTTPPMPVCSADLSKTQLSWSTTNATSVVITAVTAGSPVIPSPQGLSGSYNFVPALGVGTHTYNLTASGPGGTVLCGVTVTITPQPSPTCTLNASKSAINAGESSVLTWTTTNATSININQGINGVSANGSVTVSPTISKTYTLTASGAGGVVTCQQSIVVTALPVPVCSLNLSPTAISWTTTNATSLTLAPTTASPAVPSPGLNGSYTFSPKLAVGTHTYKLVATGTGGNVTCNATITVDPLPPDAPSCTLSASPSTVVAGDASALSWATSNAVSATIDHSVGTVTPVTSGSTAVSVPSTTTYTMTVTNSAGVTRTCATTITTTGLAPACTITVSPNSIHTGASATVSWTSSNVTSGSITPSIGSVTPVAGGSIDLFPPSDTTYTGTFTGPHGTVSCSATIVVTSGPTGCSGNCGGGLNPPNVVLYKQPTNQPLAFVSLSQIPYTGFDAGPALTILFWLAIGLLSAFIAYFVAGKGGIRYIIGYAGGRFIPQHENPAVVHEHQREAVYGSPYPNADMLAMHQQNTATAPVFHSATASIPVATPLPIVATQTPVPPPAPQSPAVNGIPDVRDVIESRAHAAGVLMSPEAVALAVGLSRDRAETLRIFGEVLNEAVRTVPRENGWVMLTTDRFNELTLSQRGVEMIPPTAEAFMPAEEIITPVVSAPSIDAVSASAFASAVVSGNREAAFSIIRSFEHDGVSPTALMTSTATALDALYRARRDNRTAPDATLADSASHVADQDLAHLVTIFTHSLDTVYTSPFTGVKLALAQAFEVIG